MPALRTRAGELMLERNLSGLPVVDAEGLLVALDLVLAGLVAIESVGRLPAEAGPGPEPSSRAGLP